jgi:hypothetical protein
MKKTPLAHAIGASMIEQQARHIARGRIVAEDAAKAAAAALPDGLLDRGDIDLLVRGHEDVYARAARMIYRERHPRIVEAAKGFNA